jgi:mRNA interferase MazF
MLAPDKPRPVVLVSRESAYESRELITVATVTTHVRDLVSHVPVGRREGLDRDSAINCDQLSTIHRSQLTSRIAKLPPVKIAELNEALRYSLGLERMS